MLAFLPILVMASTTYNWGIIGCGLISADFAKALQKSSRSNIIACAARRLESAQQFAKDFDIPLINAYSSYDDVCSNPKVDIIYVGTIHPMHCKSVITALQNGKHVLCEKPMGMNLRETEEMIATAKKNGVFLMEAMWTRFFPAYRKARELVTSGVIGDVVHYYADFGVKMPGPNEFRGARLWDNALGGGALLDIGCYVVNPLSWVFGPKMPRKMTVDGVMDKEHDVDATIGVTMMYSDRQYAQLSCTFLANTARERTISGTKGRVRIENEAHAPTKVTLWRDDGTLPGQVETFEFALPDKYATNFPNGEGMLYQIEAVTKCVDEGRLESPEYSWNEMLSTVRIMDEIRSQIGLKYPADSVIQSKL